MRSPADLGGPRFRYETPPELRGEPAPRRPVVIVGAGPVGLTCAIDLATHGIASVVLDDNDTVSVGSRAICWAKRTLEIWDRLGVGQRMVDKGVTWNAGRVFHRDRELYRFNLLPEHSFRRPAFINLQQYYVEEYLVERSADFPGLIDIRWRNEVVGLGQDGGGVSLEVRTPEGSYAIGADWVVAADGARSPVRTAMGLAFDGQTFEERFLIADVRLQQASVSPERLFWFEPTFHAGQSALMHRQPDSVYRIDFQLGPDADPIVEREPERVLARVRSMLGAEIPVDLEWCSVYAFRCARLQRFVEGRVVFAGDSAHVVSPFGARGGNGGIQDVDNLAWKLALVIKGRAPEALIATYDEERGHGADENIRNSTRATTFMSPRSPAERRLRDCVLDLAADHPFARALVNGGRLSTPCSLANMALQTPGDAAGVGPGDPCPDAPLTDAGGSLAWLLDQLGGEFTVLTFGVPDRLSQLERLAGVLPARVVHLRSPEDDRRPPPFAQAFRDVDGLARRRFGAADGTTFLIRPDQHAAARLDEPDPGKLVASLRRATATPT